MRGNQFEDAMDLFHEIDRIIDGQQGAPENCLTPQETKKLIEKMLQLIREGKVEGDKEGGKEEVTGSHVAPS
jgi:hypothetical protein